MKSLISKKNFPFLCFYLSAALYVVCLPFITGNPLFKRPFFVERTLTNASFYLLCVGVIYEIIRLVADRKR